MTLWEYLIGHMRAHASAVAFSDGTTYGELIELVCERAKKYRGSNRLVCADGNTKAEHAVEILSVLASGNVALPINGCYGNGRADDIKRLMAADSDSYPDLAFVMFTSGTGGKQKGVMLSHENIIENLEMIKTYFRIDENDTVLIARPLLHIAVVVGELLYGLVKGAKIAFYEGAFMPSGIKRAVEQTSATVLCGTPTLFRNLLRVCPAGLPLNACVLSGEILPPELAKSLTEAWSKTEFYNVYGLTEHSPRVSALLPKDFAAHCGSVGKALCGVDIKIKGGELFVRSRCVMRGYYKDAAATFNKTENGWLRTGDMAHVDKEGYLHIDGRKDNMIIRSGLNIYPEEIERAANSCAGVESCVAYGEKDDVEGQTIVLAYCGEVSEQELRAYLLRNLDTHLLPRVIKKTDNLPTTPSGKTVRRCETK